MRAPSLIAFAPGTWRWPEVYGSTRYHLWNLAGLGWRVLYVEPPVKLRPRQEIWRAPDRCFIVLRPSWVPPFAVRYCRHVGLSRFWRRVVSRRMVSEALTRAKEEGIRPDALWLGAPWHEGIRDWAERLFRKDGYAIPSLFHVYDELVDSPVLGETARELLAHWEDQLVRRASAVLCSSLPQLEKRKASARRVRLLENAVDGSFLDSDREPPAETSPYLKRLDSVPRPRIGYGGVVDLRLDTALFKALLDDLPKAQLVFMGPMSGDVDARFAGFLEAHPRAHVLGHVPYSSYPFLFQQMDVLVHAHRLTAFTEGMYPEKINEYLSSGKAIVSVRMSEVERLAQESGHPRAIRLAGSASGFVEAVREALDDSDPQASEARRAIARNHTWQREAEKLDRWLRRACGRSGSNPGGQREAG